MTSLFIHALKGSWPLALALALSAPAVSAHANPDGGFSLAGTHGGRTVNGAKQDVELILEPIAERKGSYLGILNHIEGVFRLKSYRIGLYVVDPLSASDQGSYSMTPLRLTNDGYIGVNNADPSLVMTITEYSPKLRMTIEKANSTNEHGFQGSIVLEGSKKTKTSWIGYSYGQYEGSPGKAELPVRQPGEFESQATFHLWGQDQLQGKHVVEEKWPGLFVMKRVQVSSTGVKVESIPRRIGFFIAWGKKRDEINFVMVNPDNDRDITIIQKKN